MAVLFNETQIKGLTTELICMQKFIELGYILNLRLLFLILEMGIINSDTVGLS